MGTYGAAQRRANLAQRAGFVRYHANMQPRGREIAPGIWSTPGVLGGDPCIGQTRIPVWLVEQYRRGGQSDGEILENYPSLAMEDLANAWAYADAHREEIDRMIREDESDD